MVGAVCICGGKKMPDEMRDEHGVFCGVPMLILIPVGDGENSSGKLSELLLLRRDGEANELHGVSPNEPTRGIERLADDDDETPRSALSSGIL